jgi:hypothetical protein
MENESEIERLGIFINGFYTFMSRDGIILDEQFDFFTFSWRLRFSIYHDDFDLSSRPCLPAGSERVTSGI